MKKMAFKQPSARPLPAAADEWVSESKPRPVAAEGPTGKAARLTIDLPPELHASFKAACAKHRTRMVEEVRRFIEEWTQKHS
jgi:ParG